ncbi:MAG: adenylate/guanylate cyclase domain-containing protein [Verrucomicrobiae bacterium]|nr:adenylate/guanylate cyclase domain-containing protein [Verrucomicrobiae bacterium]
MNLEDDLNRALHDAQLHNARLINRMRAAGLTCFLLTLFLMSVALGHGDWHPGWLEYTYVALAFFLLLAGELNLRALRISRFAIPVFDMPMVFVIQLKNLVTTGSAGDSFAALFSQTSFSLKASAGQVAEFSVALFICLILLSAFTLSASQVFLSLGVASVLQQVLHWQAGVTVGSHLNSLIVFGLATWICVFAGKNRRGLIEAITRADARRGRLRRYFSPSVADLLEQRADETLGEGREVELTVLFADLREFTRMSETMDSPEVVRLLNECHAFLVEAVFRNGGTLDKYLGDGLMAYFNAPLPCEDHAERALRCALEMREALHSLNEAREAEGKPALRLGIGIHSGPCVVGDIGAPHRREFTAIGQTVNLASRIEAATKEAGVGILFSAATGKLVEDTNECFEVGSFEIRGCSLPLTLYSVT